ncbi:hypothetical protein BH10PSE13_BH10PSE13_19170 [soil metagenome]
MLAQAIPFVLVVLVVVLILWLKSSGRIRAPIAVRQVDLPRLGDGIITVPVRGLQNRGRFSKAKNSLRPSLSILSDGLRYKIFRETKLPFAEISQVDVRKGPFGGGHLFVRSRGNLLTINVSDLGIARAFVAALPPSVPLSTDATILRDAASVTLVAGSPGR